MDLTISAYHDSFPCSPAQVVVDKLSPGQPCFPEEFLPSQDILRLLQVKALSFPEDKSPLLAVQLWCILGEIYLVQGKSHLADLCVHEAFLHSELDSRVYALQGALQEAQERWPQALECYQLGLQMSESVACRLGCARAFMQMESLPHRLQLAWHSLLQARNNEPGDLASLMMAVDVATQMNLETLVAQLFEDARKREGCEPVIPFSFVTDLVSIVL